MDHRRGAQHIHRNLTVEPAAREESLDIDSANRRRPSTGRGSVGQNAKLSSYFYLNGGERLGRIADVKKL